MRNLILMWFLFLMSWRVRMVGKSGERRRNPSPNTLWWGHPDHSEHKVQARATNDSRRDFTAQSCTQAHTVCRSPDLLREVQIQIPGGISEPCRCAAQGYWWGWQCWGSAWTSWSQGFPTQKIPWLTVQTEANWKPYLIKFLPKSYWLGDGCRDLICQLLLFCNVLH